MSARQCGTFAEFVALNAAARVEHDRYYAEHGRPQNDDERAAYDAHMRAFFSNYRMEP